jgi:hypothetical protein
MLAFVAALLLTAITVSSACVANTAAPLEFTIQPTHHGSEIQLSFHRDRNGHSENTWSSSFRPADLAGLDPTALNSAGTRPINFAVVRDAGRIDCSGSGGNEMARGTCTITADEQFNRFLGDRGIGRPTEDQSFGLIAVNVHRALVEALSEARYPTPTVEELMELAAVEVTPAYISSLASEGYRPQSIDGLVQFGALKITPEFIGSFARAGYSNLKPDELVQLKALNITPDFVAGFDRMGYGRLPVDTLVQLKALDITPDYVRAVQQGGALPSPAHLVQLRAVTEDLHKH